MENIFEYAVDARIGSAIFIGWGSVVIIFISAYMLGKREDRQWYNLLIVALGVLIGWAVGILASPLDDVEKDRFVRYGELISAFASGYLISKLDRFLEHSLFKDKVPVTENWIRVALFSAALIAAATSTYVLREVHSKTTLEAMPTGHAEKSYEFNAAD